MNNAAMTRSMLISGILFGVLTALPPFNILNYCTCCSLFAAAGFLAAFLLKKDSKESITLGRGAQAGLGSGFLGGLVNSIFTIPVALLIQNLIPVNRELVQTLLDNLGRDGSGLARILREISADGADAVALFSSAWFFMTIARSAMTIFFFSAFATLGGILAVALLEKRPQPPAYTAPPPPWNEPVEPPPPAAPPAGIGE